MTRLEPLRQRGGQPGTEETSLVYDEGVRPTPIDKTGVVVIEVMQCPFQDGRVLQGGTGVRRMVGSVAQYEKHCAWIDADFIPRRSSRRLGQHHQRGGTGGQPGQMR